MNAFHVDRIRRAGLSARGFFWTGLFFLSGLLAKAEVVSWNFNTALPTAQPLADLSVSALTQGNNNGTTTLLTATSVSSGYTGASGGNNAGAAARIGALNTGAGGSAYFKFTLTPAAGKTLNVSAINLGARSTGTGPQAISIRTSLDGYAVNALAFSVLNNSTWVLVGGSLTSPISATAPVTVRIYGHSGAGSAAANTANWRIDDLSLTVTVTGGAPTPVAPTVSTTTPVNGASGVAIATPLTVTFDQPVTTTGSWFTLSGSTSGALAATASGGPTTFTITPSASLPYSETITATILAGAVGDQATNTALLATNYVFSFATESAPPPAGNTAELAWNFGTAAGVATPTGLPVDVTGGEVVQGNNNGTTVLLSTTSASNTYAGATGQYNAGAAARIGALDRAAGGSAYFEFALTPVAGRQLAISALKFGSRSTGTGPTAYTIYTSADGFVSPIASGALPGTTWALVTPTLASPIQGLSSTALTVRVYGHSGAGSPAAGTANWRIDDLAVSIETAVGTPVAPAVAATSPAANETAVSTSAPVTITFNQPVAVTGNWVTLTGTSSGNIPVTITGGPVVYSATAAAPFITDESVSVSITGAQVTEQAFGSLTMAANYSFQFSTFVPLKKVHEVQGSGTVSPLANTKVKLEGVVTGFVSSASGIDGFYLQEETTDQDGDPATSEGIYVYAPGSALAATLTLGDVVTTSGTVTEFNGLTELTSLLNLAKIGTAPLPAVVTVSLPAASATALERYEGMRVVFPQTLTVTGNDGLGQYGELLLSAGGRLMTPTNVIDPNDSPASGTTSTGTSNVAAVTAQQVANALASIVLDDASTVSFPAVTPYLTSANVATATRRTGDTVTGLAGVLSYRFNFYRVDPQAGAPVVFANDNPRPLTPPSVGDANIRVASANVLNYFLTLAGSGGRGADTDAERLRQRAKILAELTALNADVFGLMEIERRADNAALADLVAGLNGILGAGTYAYINSSAIAGTDLIQVALLYKPGVVTPVGAPITDTAPGASIHNRPPLAQTFSVNANSEKFTVVVNHLKSKGSGSGADADQGDGQGASNATRKQQAAMLAAFLSNPQATFGDPDVLIIGDLNSYAEEDPIDILRTAGFANQLERFHPGGTYSYQFDSQFGYLDHALANASLAAQITGASEWHVNADEPAYYDYNQEDKTSAQQAINVATPFRASDHDPVVIGLKLQPPAPQGFASWIAQYGIPAGQNGPADDFDGDGLSNLFEYALGLRPDIAGVSGGPQITETGVGLQFRFTRPKGLADVVYQVEVSSDLAVWTTWAGALVVESSAETTETLLTEVPLSDGKVFVKLVVTQP
ncbi:MAG: ExeM/NucH family extracellular endonuclease [Nibricoccus sp.]